MSESEFLGNVPSESSDDETGVGKIPAFDSSSTGIGSSSTGEIPDARLLELFSDEDIAAIESLPVGSALLFVVRGPDAGSRFLLSADTVTVGRSPKNDIFFDDVTVSRKHAKFVKSGSGYLIQDVGSLNGTYVGRERVDSHQLAPGDSLQIGKFRMIYQCRQG
ncbi:FHA domain-containing protein [Spelaeicoccus albus]|uniref:PSer/pThr/pTyr-binding forkhead associated (FHA) protein n=1 Tax=Spelaeicoccus albus TaxID=1280376 RepID=A0A7Z0D511_9MICO|nr:FHA domain-containing protein [Spelaeicoccus albus]NYI69015.1 pSer/pThr/pTyr-binding forkhead associated (FHA) protein [Spelaeicoccus albus]